MQFKQIVVAAAALAAASSFAAPAFITGASASQPDVNAALNGLCTTAGGTFHVFKGTANGKLENVLTAACRDASNNPVNFSAASGVDTVNQNVNGGSLTSVTLPILNTPAAFIDTATCTTSYTAVSTDALPAGTQVHGGCTATLSAQSEGGFSDTEPSIASSYLAAKGVDLSSVTTKSANLLQAFGVAVSDDLYVLLYKAQYGTVIPTTAGCPLSTDTSVNIVLNGYGNPLCQPSVSRAEMASIMSGSAFVQAAGTNIFNGVTGAAKVTYCRRPVTSGTQQTAQNYFLTNPASASGLSVTGGDYEMSAANAKIDQVSSALKFAVLAGSGTGDTVNCIGGQNKDSTPGTAGTISAGPQYRIGVVSGEKVAPVTFASPTTAAVGNWKFVRLSEVPLTEGTSSSKNVATAKAGRYDLVVESRYNVETGITPASTAQIMADIAANISGSSYAGMFKTVPNAGTTGGTFNHAGSDSKAPVIR